jgi:hypothetical protein
MRFANHRKASSSVASPFVETVGDVVSSFPVDGFGGWLPDDVLGRRRGRRVDCEFGVDRPRTARVVDDSVVGDALWDCAPPGVPETPLPV